MNKKTKLIYIIALLFSLMFICVVAFSQSRSSQGLHDENIGTNNVKEEIIEVVIKEKTELEIAQEEYETKLANLNNMNLSKG